MPGLFGIIQKKRKFSEGSLMSMGRRMADSMLHVPWLQAEIWGNETFCGGRVHLGVLNPGPQPLVTKHGTTRIWFDGEYFPTFQTIEAAPTADNVSQLLSGSAPALSNIDGVFTIASFDSEKQALMLANDRLGYRPLYFMETEDWFAYAGEVKALLAICDRLPELDEISLRQFFGFGHMFGQRTWWKGIELIPPASVWCIDGKGRSSRRYWNFDMIRCEPRDEAEVDGELARLWSEEVRRRLKPGRMPLLLSGGQDSRLLLAELLSHGIDVEAITFGGTNSPDMKIARLVTARARVTHRPCYLTPDNWWQRRDQAIWQTDGLVNGLHLHSAVSSDAMHSGNWYSMANIAGDLLFGGSHLHNGIVDWRNPEALLKNRYVENPFFSCEEVIAASVSDVKSSLIGASSDCFYLQQKLRRLTLTGPGCLAPYCEIVFPGLSAGLLDLMLGALPDERRINHSFYNKWLVGRYPEFFANIPWQATGRGLAESFRVKLFRKAQRAVRRTLKITNKRVTPDQWFVNYREAVRADGIREKLAEKSLLGDAYFSGALKRALIDERSSLNYQALIAILTFETYLAQVVSMASVSQKDLWLQSDVAAF